ncbi:ABC transporter permease [Bremerella cremea]|uniref:Sugar ABC transporter permease n=1 Tax=Blastopirellula marina TaxID=124 RepID=A0A2S8FBW5_9BACT|nr:MULTISPECIES: ABC transporter permease [Pirellulaceae]PQO29622.1 sugar ABC transporter permease [Blastopirellula marina]RCS42924.1 ABC transporter permease [Bremerella cremea]
MLKNAVLFLLIFAIFGITAVNVPTFANAQNLGIMARWTGLYGIMAIGAAFVIIAGGIDLSMGSMVALVGVQFGILINDQQMNPCLAMIVVLVGAMLIGLGYGLLITKLKLQPFVVTLCGLLVLRSIARFLTHDNKISNFVHPDGGTNIGYLTGAEFLSIPLPLWMLAGIALVSALVLNKTTFGRYLKALGNNEQAARYSGINTDWITISAYMICSLLSGVAAILFAIDLNSVGPNEAGTFYELYAIAAAVLGGCSLRGGTGSIIGVVLGTAILRELYQAIEALQFSELEGTVIGVVILVGVIADEIIRRIVDARRRKQEVNAAKERSGSG